MVNKDLVTIVIPTYKRANKIVRALESCINQDYKNIEIIIVDDNGEKNSKYRAETKSLVDTYIKKYGVRYIEHKENKGGSEARNTGIKEAKGFFISFLDDDDEILPNKISKQVQLYNEHKDDNVGLIYCYCEAVNEKGEHKRFYNYDFEWNPLYQQMLGCIAGTSLWFCPKHVLKEVGYFESTPSKQDTILLLKILAAGYNIFRVDIPLVKYYEYNNGKISGTGINNIKGECNARIFSRKYYSKLKTKEIINVEYVFSKKLLTLYVLNGLDDLAKKELYNMIKLKFFSVDTFKGGLKYSFKHIYKTFIEKKN
ncbi:glycosyltransferase family 2 protein [Peribacillus frigoritolerans]|uniref:glycosyltransferase family 2 protein n=1 Tax=Peribacillus frigoritolerans TaxID=450367 RepID=UPI0024C1AC4D|nr:glycosyltransferase family 2 protein [Peribacillus frigoritolerans]WHX60508.1 glycosyltransferase family 2 protein [Peribacillus frigoritolerans]